jgi:hypothetical protein
LSDYGEHGAEKVVATWTARSYWTLSPRIGGTD